jgi:PPK2 family polyphosphate:nucleotide phosphotransferase
VSRGVVRPGHAVRLDRRDPRGDHDFGGSKGEGRDELDRLSRRMGELQTLLTAERAHALLVVLQGMDAAGKDGTIRRVFDGMNPLGVRVASFKEPTPLELGHDFLWRVHAQVPALGEIVLFDRSHYEDVLVPRVHRQIGPAECERRYRAINDFERELTDEGTVVLKFFLHISRAEQRRRLEARLHDPMKQWKYRKSDVAERRLWGAYMQAYEAAISKTSTPWAPWFVVPSDRKWRRDLVVSREVVRTLQRLKMAYPSLPRSERHARVH